jgi:lipase ATG15
MLINKHPYLKPGQPSASSELNFYLRHFHVETSSAHAYLADAPHDRSQAKGLASVPLSIITSPVRTTRPTSLLDFQAARKVSQRGQSALLNWQEDEVSGPDVTRRETLLLLAKVTSNTYYEPYKRGWYNLTDDWNVVRQSSFGVLCGRLLSVFPDSGCG